MKHRLRCGVPLIFLLISLSAFSPTLTSARFFHSEPGEEPVELDESINFSDDGSRVFDLQTTIDSFNEVMGMEKCGNEEDEECLKRRVITEAHLDYIYTQHHKP